MWQAEIVREFRDIWWTLGRQDAEIVALRAAVANQPTRKASVLGALPWLRIIWIALYLLGWGLVITGYMSLAELREWLGLLGGH